MPKITTGNYRHRQTGGQYPVFYSSDMSVFYAKVDTLFDGADGFFNSMREDKELKGLDGGYHKRIGSSNLIIGKSQKELEDNVNAFYVKFVSLKTSEVKVILYMFKYITETQNTERHQISDNTNKLEMTFKYEIANKKSFGENHIYSNFKDHYQLTHWDIKNYKEIPWSQELEDFIRSFSKSFDALVDKMKPFFEIDGKIIELIGKNILMP